MRKITRLIIHASATPNNRNVTARDIDRWHKEKGWAGIGYHYVICRDGKLEKGRPLEKIGAHVVGHNKDTIGVCLVGEGLALSDFTEPQKITLRALRSEMEYNFPGITIHGHREYANKSCPGFDIKDFPWDVKKTHTLKENKKWWRFWV